LQKNIQFNDWKSTVHNKMNGFFVHTYTFFQKSIPFLLIFF